VVQLEEQINHLQKNIDIANSTLQSVLSAIQKAHKNDTATDNKSWSSVFGIGKGKGQLLEGYSTKRRDMQDLLSSLQVGALIRQTYIKYMNLTHRYQFV